MRRIVTIICLLNVFCNLQAQLKVTAALDNSKILIGDHARLHLEAQFPDDHTIQGVDLSPLDSIFSEIDPNKTDQDPGTLEVLDQTEWETLKGGGITTYRKDVTLTCWKEGVYFIPQIRFSFERKGTTFTRATNKLTLLVSSPIEASEAVDTVKLAPIKNIVEEEWRFSDFLPILYLIGGAVLFLVFVVWLIMYIIRKREGPPPINVVHRPAHEIALFKLKELQGQELWQQGEVKVYQSQLTYIIREYIENRYKVLALESTTGGILRDLKEVDFPNDLVEKMREMLQLADMVKFAKANPPIEMHDRLMSDAFEVVNTTKLVLTEEEQQQITAGAPGVEASFILPTQYAPPGRRFLAFLIDWTIFQVGFGLVMLLVNMALSSDEPGISIWPILINILLFFGLGIIYFAYMHSTIKQTAGKRILKLEVVRNDGKNLSMGRAIVRFFIKVLSMAIFFLPILPILFNKQKQGLHDMVVNSVTIRKK